MMKRLVGISLCCFVLVAVAAGATKLIRLKGGRQLTGEVVKNKDGSYEVTTDRGVVVTVPGDDVLAIEDVVTPTDEFKTRRAKLDPKDAQAHYDLALWAFRRELYTRAKQMAEKALSLDAKFEDAKLLLRQIDAAIKSATDKPKPPDGNGTKKPPAVNPKWFLGDEDIFRVRLAELRAKDKVSITFKNDVLNRFLDSMAGREPFTKRGAERDFRKLSRVRQTVTILNQIDEDDVAFRNDIQVTRDPQFMTRFRGRVWPIVRQGCAAAKCHGGVKIQGGFRLFIQPRNVRTDYTNFVILSTYVKRSRRMVARDDANISLLLHYGLPTSVARYKHPEVLGLPIRPMFATRKAGNYRRILSWIEGLKGPFPPARHYRLTWRPPFKMSLDLTGRPLLPPIEPAETRPATRPAGPEPDERDKEPAPAKRGG